MPSVRTESQPIAAASVVAPTSAGRQPPWPAEADAHHAAGAEDRDQVAGEPGDRHLRQRDHAAVAAEEGERERDQAERERLRADLVREERRGEERIGDDRRQNDEAREPRRRRHRVVANARRRR
jgi:hypothetical protein